MGELGRLVDKGGSRIEVLEINATRAANSLMEVQGTMTVVGQQVSDLMTAANSGDPWSQFRAAAAGAPAAAAPATPAAAPAAAPAYHDMSPGAGVSGAGVKWLLYDEKFILHPSLDKVKYNPKNPLEWMQDIRDYVAGRTEELDSILNWVARQSDEIDDDNLPEDVPMVNKAPSLKEVSRQLWAMLNPLIKDSAVSTSFANVTRHHGLEAWRKLAEPVNEDKLLLRKDLLPKVNAPRAAATPTDIEQAIEDWDTTIRLYKKAGGAEPTDADRRLTLLQILPAEIAAHATMHMDSPEHDTYLKLKKYVIKYVKTLKGIKRSGARPAHLVDDHDGGSTTTSTDYNDHDNIDDPERAELVERLAATEDPEERIEILAFMKTRGFRPPTRGQGGQRQRQQQKPEGPARFMPSATLPPRNRNDIRCVNCGRPGHTAPECRQKQVDKKDRPCFECGECGHEARACPKKRARQQQQRKDVRAVETAEPQLRPTLTVSIVEPRHGPARQAVTVGSFVAGPKPKKQNGNRFQPLSDAMRSELQSAASSELASVPSDVKLTSSSPELIASPGRCPLPLTRQAQPKLAEAVPGARGGGDDGESLSLSKHEVRSHKAPLKISDDVSVWPIPAASLTPIAHSTPAPPTHNPVHTTTYVRHTAAKVPCSSTTSAMTGATPPMPHNTTNMGHSTIGHMGTGHGGVASTGEETRNNGSGQNKGSGRGDDDCSSGFGDRDMTGKIQVWEQIAGNNRARRGRSTTPRGRPTNGRCGAMASNSHDNDDKHNDIYSSRLSRNWCVMKMAGFPIAGQDKGGVLEEHRPGLPPSTEENSLAPPPERGGGDTSVSSPGQSLCGGARCPRVSTESVVGHDTAGD